MDLWPRTLVFTCFYYVPGLIVVKLRSFNTGQKLTLLVVSICIYPDLLIITLKRMAKVHCRTSVSDSHLDRSLRDALFTHFGLEIDSVSDPGSWLCPKIDPQKNRKVMHHCITTLVGVLSFRWF